jgi:hypothetical protein
MVIQQYKTMHRPIYLKDASFVRLKNIQVGYNVPKVILDKVKLQSLRVYFAGDNLLTISKFLDLTLSVLALAVTMCHIHKTKVFTFGLNAQF